ncbi:hypothetical protein AB0M68_35185 [Streptomyces sp. NPDC051453]|uniref:hypothetical protein n=1 Tax=Streptomyces sp. NPDC051453 TaxID=3154941 RepID=UPI00341A43BF
MTPDLSFDAVAPGQGRTSQRILSLTMLLVVLVLTVLSGLLVRTGLVGDSWCMLALFSPAIGLMGWSILGEARTVELRDDHLLTARTLCGRRTVDLTRLTKVRRIEVWGPSRTVDQLALKDAHGVRLVINRGHDAAVREAITQTPTGKIAVSRRAAKRLQLTQSTLHAWQTYVLAMLCTITLIGTVMMSGLILLTVSLVIAGRA